MGRRPIPKEELAGWEPPELAGLLQGAAPHPRHRLLILPAAQQFRLGVAFSFGLTKTHTGAHPARHALQSTLGFSTSLVLATRGHTARRTNELAASRTPCATDRCG